MDTSIEEKLKTLKDTLDNVKNEWSIPVLIIKHSWKEQPYYLYPYDVLDNLKFRLNVNYLEFRKKSETMKALKMLVDLYQTGKYSIELIHFGLYVIYLNYNILTFDEKTLGKRRFDVYKKMPSFKTVNNDEFLMRTWNSMVRNLKSYDINPYLKNVRLLVSSDLFSEITGTHYYDADIVEPISSKEYRSCNTFTSEKDPMLSNDTNEGYTLGEIYLKREIYGYRHYIGKEALHTGSRIEVKFGDGWIPGRYESSLTSGDSAIKIYSSRGDYFTISEGSLVRIKK